MTLTPKQEEFCQKYIELGNASKAYREVYSTQGMKPETVNRKAKELMDNGKITARIAELQEQHTERHKITVDDLLAELEEARELAKTKENAGAMITATLGKAKLLGLDKQMVEVNTTNHQTFEEWVKELDQQRGKSEPTPNKQSSNKDSKAKSFEEWVKEQEKE